VLGVGEGAKGIGVFFDPAAKSIATFFDPQVISYHSFAPFYCGT